MSLNERMARALNRIASLTSIARTRSEDAVRAENHKEMATRLESVVLRLEALADEMEKALT